VNRAVTWREWGALAAALVVLNFCLTFENVWPTFWITPTRGLSIELALLILGVALAALRWGSPSPRVLTLLSLLLVVLTIGRYAEVTARALYGRPINLYYDAGHFPRIVAMFAESSALWLLVTAAAALILSLAMIYFVARWALGRIGTGVAVAAPRRALIMLCSGLILLYAAGHASERITSEDLFWRPVSAMYTDQARLLVHAKMAAAASESGPASLAVASDLHALGGADVYVVFVESYGAVTYDQPAYAEALAATRKTLASAIAASGRAAVSGFVRSPTFGGASWLAHVSLLSGIDVRSGETYNHLMIQRRDTLVQTFARHGYRTIALMPGLRQDWPEGAFYRFDDIYHAARLGYRGPEFGWWRIPDQYTLAKFDRMESSGRPLRPRFVVFPTISSHAPFRPTPPYQADWERLLSDRPFDPDDARRAFAQHAEWTNLGPGYVDSISYTLTSLAGYVRQHPDRDVVLIVLGDHQPPAGIAGEAASWDVPVHVIASRPALLETLARHGFTPGLYPERRALGAMHELTLLLLDAFDGAHGKARASAPTLSHTTEPSVNVTRASPARQLQEEGSNPCCL
jgi:hypothetical protein